MSGGDDEEASRPSTFVKVEDESAGAADGEPGEHKTTWQMQMEEARKRVAESVPGEHKTTWQINMEIDETRK
eukprot:1869152-Amphidinium_carterae.1